jgi:hypothetical protein
VLSGPIGGGGGLDFVLRGIHRRRVIRNGHA